MRQDKSLNNRWLLSSACGLALLAASGSAALAQNVPTSDATAPQGPGPATQVIQLKPGQEAGTPTVMPADTAGNPAASTQDAHFVWAASATNQAEIVLGKLAQDRGQSPNEQNYGRMLQGDHGNAEQALSAIADPLMLKTAPGPNPMQTAMLQHLQSVPDDQFDAAFNHAMIRGHEHAIAMFRKEAMTGQNPQLRDYARQSLPVLERHLQVAEQMSPMPMGGPAMATMAPAPGMAPPPPPGPVPGTIASPVSGNPDQSADQLNGRILQFNGQS
jgi:putative membrane protein